MLSCIAVDDEPLALRLVAEFAERHPALLLLRTFSNPLEAKTFMEKESVDLLFLDVDMLEINGVDFARTLSPRPLLVFTTAHRAYAVDGFDLDSVDYLLKPFDYTRFERAVDKALTRSAPHTYRPFLTVYEEYQLVKIHLDEIECIESMQDYVKIHLINGRTVLTLSTLKAMHDRLPKNIFVRIHRSYIVSVTHVVSFYNKKIELPRFLLNVGESYYKDVARLLKDSSTH
ncbi:response regulator transcription factor [Sphingobacterium alkalisoli]|uniref:Response regulator transcription factor n=1 Tax=Sphingobacterium alkalisoli TaxID=1874115 RepID=A0A4U0H621_9SPHI|nr:LytTR family DNA-binding domain-containing protein [Sphingobacterium alkalisoli]TJY65782.1 response regulator transcription factor [Sphingobacterium alkalisoli]GGH18347.1 DNA-binding response regulator [Sphingobacterium alkalisoli]